MGSCEVTPVNQYPTHQSLALQMRKILITGEYILSLHPNVGPMNLYVKNSVQGQSVLIDSLLLYKINIT